MANARRIEAVQAMHNADQCYWAMVNINSIAFRRVEGMSEEMFEQRKLFLLTAQQLLDKEFHLLMDQACNAWRVYRNPPKPRPADV